MMSEALVHTQG